MQKFWLALVFCSLATMARAEEEGPIPSPDKKWEYRLVEEQPVIVSAKTGQTVIDFDVGTALAAETGRVVWAPDSRRLAFNYRAGGRYYTCAIYELAGKEWKALPDLETEAKEVSKMIDRAEDRERKRLGVGKDAYRRRIHDEWKVLRWLDRDTFEAFATSTGTVLVKKEEEEPEWIGGAVVFTVKCDNKGGWKLLRLREPSDAELEGINNDDQDASGNVEP